jgi:TRAP-type C4-dicarboxylate transport system permease small subunit
MIRIVVENLLLFLTPAAIYFAYVYLMSDRQATTSTGAVPPKSSIFDGAPYAWLFIAGILLVLFVLIAFSTSSGGKPGQTYTPAAIKDGKIQPGRTE